MRKINTLVILAATLIPVTANAQTTSTSEVVPSRGWVDFGVRGTSITGDSARYERYRDLGDGLFLEGFRWRAEKKGWFMDFDASHVARRDQRYIARFVRPGQFKGALWDQIPMLLSETTRTPYILTGANEFRLPDSTQLQLQGLLIDGPACRAAGHRERGSDVRSEIQAPRRRGRIRVPARARVVHQGESETHDARGRPAVRRVVRPQPGRGVCRANRSQID